MSCHFYEQTHRIAFVNKKVIHDENHNNSTFLTISDLCGMNHNKKSTVLSLHNAYQYLHFQM